jgi:hypothetical protein
MVLVVAVELIIRTSVLVDVGQNWWTFDDPGHSPDGPETAQERSWLSLTIN